MDIDSLEWLFAWNSSDDKIIVTSGRMKVFLKLFALID